MRKVLCGLVLAMAVAGCGSNGLSPREQPGQNYSLYMSSMYDGAMLSAAGANDAPIDAAPLVFPVRMGVAQIGEFAPPDEMLETLRAQTQLFARITPIPGVSDMPEARGYQQRASRSDDQRRAREHLRAMRQMGVDMGLTHLLIFGGTIDHANNSTSLSAANLTVVGAFVVPTREITAHARATAAMLDVRSGRVVMMASTTADATKHATAAGSDNDQLKLLKDLRDKVVEQLTTEIVESCEQRAGASPQAMGSAGE